MYARDSYNFRQESLASNVKVAKDTCELFEQVFHSNSVSQIKPEHEVLFSHFEGTASYAWQNDILSTVFDELNPFTPNTPDLLVCSPFAHARASLSFI